MEDAETEEVLVEVEVKSRSFRKNAVTAPAPMNSAEPPRRPRNLLRFISNSNKIEESKIPRYESVTSESKEERCKGQIHQSFLSLLRGRFSGNSTTVDVLLNIWDPLVLQPLQIRFMLPD
jgi:CCR4-NOT transcriptional regulation complex NOT5 subunit